MAAISVTMRPTPAPSPALLKRQSSAFRVWRSVWSREIISTFAESAAFAVVAARKVLEEGLPEGTLLNINLPAWRN